MATLFPIIIITITSFMFHVPLHYNHFPSTLAFFFPFGCGQRMAWLLEAKAAAV